MKEANSGLTCGVCGKQFVSGLNWHICLDNDWRNNVRVDSKYVKGCPVCFSSVVVFRTNKETNEYLTLCKNPSCSSYVVAENREDIPYYEIYSDYKHLASFIIRKDGKAGFIWSLQGNKLFHKMVNQVAKEFVKEKIVGERG